MNPKNCLKKSAVFGGVYVGLSFKAGLNSVYNSNMIIGIGTDIVEIERIKNAIEKWGGRFLKRVFTENEIAYCINRKDPSPNLAVRFAAKEAFVKALSSTEEQRKIINISDFKEIEILNYPSGKPFINLLGNLKTILPDEIVIHLSLSHERNYALATVVLERKRI